VLKYELLGLGFTAFEPPELASTYTSKLQHKTPKIMVQKSSHFNNISINMVVVVVIQSHVLIKRTSVQGT